MATNTTDAAGATDDDDGTEAVVTPDVVSRWFSKIKTAGHDGRDDDDRQRGDGKRPAVSATVEPPALLTIDEAARRLRVSRATFFRLRHTYDDFPKPVRYLVRGVRYFESDIDAFAQRRMRAR